MSDLLFLSITSTCMLLCLGLVTLAICASSGIVADEWLWLTFFGQLPLLGVMIWVNGAL